MVSHTTAPGDVERGLDERMVVLVEKKPSAGRLCKMSVAILVVALCLGGILLLAWFWPGLKLCCEDISQRLTFVFFSSDHHSTLRQISSKAKAAIHLEGNYEEDDDGSQGRLEWKSGQGQAFAQGGFRLEGNKIVIPHTGLYFVYSQSSFRVSCGDGDEEGAGQSHVPLSHRVWRYTNSLGKEASLMNAVRSACQNAPQEDGFRDGQGWYNAIYLGAVFKLNKGDRLRTETNQLSELETDDGKTFFGVFAL
uniref:Lymphotoxin-alpha n=1 Tax=Gasterosteus aculeatus TaxID=69293 RepID=G3PJA0_GASAC